MLQNTFLHEPFPVNGGVIVSVQIVENGILLEINDTIFHPRAGGQHADRGNIDGVAVKDVIATGGKIFHFVTGGCWREGQKVLLTIDSAWRQLNSRYHSAGHAIASVGEASYLGYQAIEAVHYPGNAVVSFEATGDKCLDNANDVKRKLNEALVNVIHERLPVRVHFNSFFPRVVQIGNSAPIPCLGTHVENTAQLEGFSVIAVRKRNQKLNVAYGV